MLKFVTGLCVCFVLAGCQTQANRDVGNWYDWQVVKQPSNNRIRICHGFDCHYQEPLIIDDGSIAKLGEIIAEGSGSAAEERQALAKAVQWFEILVGPIVGSDKDIGGFVGDASGERGQMDCIDEATNTTSLFLLAEKNGFIKHHIVKHPVARGFLLDGRFPHATAVIEVTVTGAQFAIDSWVYDNGVIPDVIPLEKWFSAWSTEDQQKLSETRQESKTPPK